VDLARVLCRAPEVRLLRTLVILDSAAENSQNHFFPGDDVPETRVFPSLFVLRQARQFGNVRTLHIGDCFGHDNFIIHSDAEPVPDLLSQFPRLRELGVNGAWLTPSLLFRRKEMKRLHTLRLDRMEVGASGCRALVRSGLLKKLKVLQMWNCRLEENAAEVLADCSDLPRLEQLDVSFNWLSPDDVERLRRTGVNLQAEYMIEPWEDPDNLDDEADEFDDDWE
jgi:hypothetical protein